MACNSSLTAFRSNRACSIFSGMLEPFFIYFALAHFYIFFITSQLYKMAKYCNSHALKLQNLLIFPTAFFHTVIMQLPLSTQSIIFYIL